MVNFYNVLWLDVVIGSGFGIIVVEVVVIMVLMMLVVEVLLVVDKFTETHSGSSSVCGGNSGT